MILSEQIGMYSVCLHRKCILGANIADAIRTWEHRIVSNKLSRDIFYAVNCFRVYIHFKMAAVIFPCVGQQFPDCEQFGCKLKAYENATKYVFTTFKSESIASANKSVRKEEQKYPDQWKYWTITLGCKQGKKRPSESAGKRPLQS